MLIIPLYRAKKIDSDEYVEGQLVIDSAGQTIIIQDCVIYGDFKADKVWQQGVYNSFNFIVDPTTLAINFNDMTDSQGNKIFASLSKDGKGGDKFRFYYNKEDYVVIFEKCKVIAKNINKDNDYCSVESLIEFDNIGIQ